MNQHFVTRFEVLQIFCELQRPGDHFTLRVDTEDNRARARARARAHVRTDAERAKNRDYMRRERAMIPKKGVTFRGETMSLAAWARRLGVSSSTLYHRKMLGWPLERILAVREGEA